MKRTIMHATKNLSKKGVICSKDDDNGHTQVTMKRYMEDDKDQDYPWLVPSLMVRLIAIGHKKDGCVGGNRCSYNEKGCCD